jgi:hypothetical protein
MATNVKNLGTAVSNRYEVGGEIFKGATELNSKLARQFATIYSKTQDEQAALAEKFFASPRDFAALWTAAGEYRSAQRERFISYLQNYFQEWGSFIRESVEKVYSADRLVAEKAVDSARNLVASGVEQATSSAARQARSTAYGVQEAGESSASELRKSANRTVKAGRGSKRSKSRARTTRQAANRVQRGSAGTAAGLRSGAARVQQAGESAASEIRSDTTAD